MSARKTVVLTTFEKESPAASRSNPTFSSARRVCAAMSPSTRVPVAGFIGTWPDTKSREPERSAGEYGPTGLADLLLEIDCLAIAAGTVQKKVYAAFVTLPERRQRVHTR